MASILNLDSFKIEKKLKEQVIDYLENKNFKFEIIRNKDECIIILTPAPKHVFLVYMRYVEERQETIYPTLLESFENINLNTHISFGEWVVLKILQPKSQDKIETVFKSRSLSPPEAFNFLKDKISI